MMENTDNILQLESEIVKVLRNIYDPEIPVNIYDLGLIYDIDIDEAKEGHHHHDPHCPELSGCRSVADGSKG